MVVQNIVRFYLKVNSSQKQTAIIHRSCDCSFIVFAPSPAVRESLTWAMTASKLFTSNLAAPMRLAREDGYDR